METEVKAVIPAAPGALDSMPIPDAYWRSLQLFNAYRAAAALLLLTAAYWGDLLQFGSRDMSLFLIGASAYAGFGAAMFALIRTRERFTLQLAIQVGGDIAFIVLLMYASGGLSSGLGVVVGGLILGVTETLTGYYISTGYKDVPGLVLLLLVLSLRPSGLFGKATIKKV